ncbi:MAG: hypothetical protein MUE69_05130 [Myxococcota bacterium]|nr:hypothetical protein [Myxococcota bacterium]
MILEAALGGALVATAALVWRRVHERRAMQKRTGEEASAAETTKEAAKDVAKDVAQKVTKATASTAKPVAKTSAAGATKASELAKSVGKKGKPSGESKPHRSGPRGLRVGDVLLYADTELWLAGSFELDEEGLVARVFRAPGNDRAPWVIQLDPDAQKIVLARDCGAEVPGGRVPAELPIGGMRLSLERRGHAKVTVEGELDAPDAKTLRAEYVRMTGPGGRELLVVDFEGGARLALAGERTGRELFDFLPGGDD